MIFQMTSPEISNITRYATIADQWRYHGGNTEKGKARAVNLPEDSSTALISSFLFLTIFVIITLLPWILTINKKGWMGDFNRAYWENRIEKGSDIVDYIITTELPDSLRKTIYIEDDGKEVHLKSNLDDSFHRKYKLPEDFMLDEFDYEYEGKFLLLKLKLKRSI